MTLDEAIKHAEERATACDDECGQEHAQLAEWLRELRDIRKARNDLTTAYEGVCKRYNEADDNYIATINYLYGKVASVEVEYMRLQRDYDNLRKAMWDRAHARAIQHMTEDELRATCAELFDYVDELKTLAQRLYYCGQRDSECDRCGMNGADIHVKMSDVDYCDGINMCMRDLEIEVGDD